MAQLKTLTINDTGFIKLPSGTTAQRPSVPTTGMMRFNTDLSCNEYYDGTNWIDPVTGAAPVVTTGLVLNLDAGISRSYPGSGTIWRDLSGYGNNGTLTNGPTYTSSNGGGLVFDGVNDSIEVLNSSSFTFTNQLTVSIWCSASSLYNYAGFFGKPSSSAWGDGWALYYEANYIFFYVNNWSTYRTGYYLGSGVNSFSLTNFVGTYDGANIKLYRNGTYIGQTALTANILNTSANLGIMRVSPGGYFAAGNCYNFSVYNRALTATEILNNYNSLKGRFGL